MIMRWSDIDGNLSLPMMHQRLPLALISGHVSGMFRLGFCVRMETCQCSDK